MLETITNTLQKIVKTEGDITSMLVYPLLLVVVYEVFMRYVFE